MLNDAEWAEAASQEGRLSARGYQGIGSQRLTASSRSMTPPDLLSPIRCSAQGEINRKMRISRF